MIIDALMCRWQSPSHDGPSVCYTQIHHLRAGCCATDFDSWRSCWHPFRHNRRLQVAKQTYGTGNRHNVILPGAQSHKHLT